jgi:hypothetical protein
MNVCGQIPAHTGLWDRVAFRLMRLPKNFFAPGGHDNPLKWLVSDKGIQGNPSLFLGKIWLGIGLAWLDLAKFGFRLELALRLSLIQR